MRDGLIVKKLACLISQREVGIMQHVADKVHHVYRGHIENCNGGSHARHYCYHHNETTIPERGFEPFFDNI